jgi:hypothetical protein
VVVQVLVQLVSRNISSHSFQVILLFQSMEEQLVLFQAHLMVTLVFYQLPTLTSRCQESQVFLKPLSRLS